MFESLRPMIKLIKNKMFDQAKVKESLDLLSWDPGQIEDFHRTIGNQETPLVRLSGLAEHLGVGQILLKDESPRFGLNAFKALGASYACLLYTSPSPRD